MDGDSELDSRPAKIRRRESWSSDSGHVSARRRHKEDNHESSSRPRHDREQSQSDRHDSTQGRQSYRRSRSPMRRSKNHDRDERKRHSIRDSRRDSRDSRQRQRQRHYDRDRSRSNSRESHLTGRHRDGQDNDHDKRHMRRHRDQPHERNRHRRKSTSPSPQPHERSRRPLPSQKDAFTTDANPEQGLDKPATDKQKPNFGLTGKLAAASNTIQTAGQKIVLKYHEPAEARKPSTRDPWRLYVFKGDEILEMVELTEQSCWLFGREGAVADFPIDHPSCSKQHAVIQFRYIERKNEFGDRIGKVRPYVIDLESANGTSVNDELVPAAKYVELRDKDVVKFGHSSREYMIQLPPKA